MNAKRRKVIEDLNIIIKDALANLEEVKDEEECYIENMPENLQGGTKYEQSETIISNLEDAISSLNDAIDTLGAVEE